MPNRNRLLWPVTLITQLPAITWFGPLAPTPDSSLFKTRDRTVRAKPLNVEGALTLKLLPQSGLPQEPRVRVSPNKKVLPPGPLLKPGPWNRKATALV